MTNICLRRKDDEVWLIKIQWIQIQWIQIKKVFFLLFFSLLFFLPQLRAGSVEWAGQYRVEGLTVLNPNLEEGEKSYWLHHLTLRPKVVAYDGLKIYSRLDIFNNPLYPDEALGAVWGGRSFLNPSSSLQGESDPFISSGASEESGRRPTWASQSHILRDQQPSGTLRVNELYAQWEQEFFSFMVGRAPLHFGLGMSFNGGMGEFDHWLENRDLIAIQIFLGGFTIVPILAKSWEGLLGRRDDVNDYIVQAYYKKPDSRLQMGAIWQLRDSSNQGMSNDSPAPQWIPGSRQESQYLMHSYNFFVSQWVGSVKVDFELGFTTGRTGLEVDGESVQQEGLGGVLQVHWKPESSGWGVLGHLGYASGDNPGTPSKWEGYVFDPNYDVAFLLFNHPLGRGDFLGTSYLRPDTPDRAVENNFDTETVSNAFFVSAALQYSWSEKYSLRTQGTYARLNQSLVSSGGSLDAGLEWDLSFSYQPFKGFRWVNRLGVLFPGGAFQGGGSSSFNPQGAYAVESRAVVRF